MGMWEIFFIYQQRIGDCKWQITCSGITTPFYDYHKYYSVKLN